MATRPCRSCGRTLAVTAASQPQPMCHPCRRLNPQRKQPAPKVSRCCRYCGKQLRHSRSDNPACTPCRDRMRRRALDPQVKRARARMRAAQRKLTRAALGTHGTPMIWTQGQCNWCEAPFTTRGSEPARWCSEACSTRAGRARRRNAQFGGTAWRWSDFMRIARRFNYRCAYCNIEPERLDPDHVVPLARGGDDSLSNLLPTCMPCNSDKRDLLLDEWHTDRQRRGLPERNTTCDGPRYVHLALRTAAPRATAA